VIVLLVPWLVLEYKGCLIQLAQFAVLEDTMRITLVVAVCVAVVLLGQARISSQEVPDVESTAKLSIRIMKCMYNLIVRLSLTCYAGNAVAILYMW